MTTRVRPPESSGQLPFATLGALRLVVTGCPLSDTPVPDTNIVIANVSNVARYSWRITASGDNDDPLVVRQGAKKDVSVQVDIVRERRYQRSVAFEGVVELVARGTKPMTVSSVQVSSTSGYADCVFG